MDSDELIKIFESKAKRRQELARLPIPVKIQMVIQLQKLAAPLLLQRGKKVTCWSADM